MPIRTTITHTCPGGFCDYIQKHSDVLIVILCIDAFIFFVTLVPPLFSWSKKKPDGRKRIYFAALACITFYFWLAFLAVNSLYCFGFLAHEGPCKDRALQAKLPQINLNGSTQSPEIPWAVEKLEEVETTTASSEVETLESLSTTSNLFSDETPGYSSQSPRTSSTLEQEDWSSSDLETSFSPSSGFSAPYSLASTVLKRFSPKISSSHSAEDSGTSGHINHSTRETSSYSTPSKGPQVQQQQLPTVLPLIWGSEKNCSTSNSSKATHSISKKHETELNNLTLVNILIVVVLFLVLIANAKEGEFRSYSLLFNSSGKRQFVLNCKLKRPPLIDPRHNLSFRNFFSAQYSVFFKQVTVLLVKTIQ